VALAVDRGFSVGVAAFPDGHPASSGNSTRDVDVLVKKFELGATFATTQFFFDVSRYQRLRDQLSDRGMHRPLIAGILPITNIKQLIRMAELGGTPLPKVVIDRISRFEEDPISLRKEGIEIASELATELIAIGAPGLHFYTMNSADSTLEITAQIGLR
jgi:methylenetetrahydrofolate reductase (NADPH)